MKQTKILDYIVMGIVFMVMLAIVTEPAAAQGSDTGEVVGAVLTRIIVIAGATVLVSAWQKWRERQGKK
jgi:hypothetical protein